MKKILMEEMEEQKPFACKWDGCGKSFTNEDHWSVHSKKHEMSLNLGLANRSSSFIDQTPTPTRLFKQWEEVGLFDELHENPFEETFRRAVESKSTPVLTNLLQAHPPINNEITTTNDDTLHTPQIFSHYNGTTSETNTTKEIRKVDENLLKPKEENLKCAIKRNYREIMDNSAKYLRTVPVSELIPKTANVILVQKINPAPINVSVSKNTKILPKIVEPKNIKQEATTDLSVKDKLKSMILKVPKTEPPIESNLTIEKKKDLPEMKKVVSVKSPQLVKSSPVKLVTKVKCNNKEILEERQRYAAQRYRNKKKKEQNHILKLNDELKLENSLLKEKLKAFELAHRNCSVTKQPIIYLLTNTKLPNS